MLEEHAATTTESAKGRPAEFLIVLFSVVLTVGLVLVVCGRVQSRRADSDQAGEATASAAKASSTTELPSELVELDAEAIKELERRPRELSNQEVQQVAHYYRKQIPFISLRDRLAYEQRLPSDRPAPRLMSEVEADPLEPSEEDRDPFQDFRSPWRAISLSTLHSENVESFVRRENLNLFGAGRMLPPGPESLILPELESIPVEPRLISAAEQQSDTPRVLPLDEPNYGELIPEAWTEGGPVDRTTATIEAYDAWTTRHNPLLLPTIPRLKTMHYRARNEFSDSERNGHVRSVDRVAGFMPHALSEIPQLRLSVPRSHWEFAGDEVGARYKAKPLWKMTRLQLVSLLKYDSPGVYESNNLPNMSELVDISTRPLDEFESSALEKLNEGHDLVTRAHTNRVVMVGSLRARKQCLECHDVQPGELLGAFSYELTRQQPIDGPPGEKKPAF